MKVKDIMTEPVITIGETPRYRRSLKSCSSIELGEFL
jgi:hypothetical protein